MRAKVQNFTFFHTLRSQDNMIHAGFNMQVAKTPTYPVLCRLPLFVALWNHNPPTLHRDRKTDIMPIP